MAYHKVHVILRCTHGGRHLSADSGGPASSADDSPVRGENVEQSTAVAAGPPAPLPCGLFAPGRENVE